MTEKVSATLHNQAPVAEQGFEAVDAAIRHSVLLGAYNRDVNTAFYFMDTIVDRAADMYAKDSGLVDMLVEKQVEGLHGTRSGSLLSLLEHGLVPHADQGRLSAPVVTGEHATQPTYRDGTHFVHWIYAHGTRRYAEEGTERSDSGLSIHNYKDILAQPDEYITAMPTNSMVRTLLEKRKRNAREFEQWLDSGKATAVEIALHQKDFPIVLGVSLDGIEPGVVEGAASHIVGDTIVRDTIPAQNVKVMFVPQTETGFVRDVGVPLDIAIVPLESLRAATTEYTW